MRNFLVLMIVLLGFSATSSAQTVTPQTAYAYPDNIDYLPYQHTVFTSVNSIGVMGLTVNDAGSDGLPTVLKGITFSISTVTGNAIFMAAIYSGGVKIDTCTVVNGATSIAFTHTTLSVANGTSVNLELRLMFKTAVTDRHQMQFTVSSVTAASTGSSFSSPNGGGATSPAVKNKLVVVADRYKFGQQPTDVFAGQIIMPTVTVKAVDKNNNLDSDYVSNIKLDITNSIPSCDTLAGNLVKAIGGTATFSALIPNVADYGVMITTIGGLLTSPPVTNSFDVNSAQVNTLIKWNFNDANITADGGTNTNFLSKDISTTSTGAIGFGTCDCIGDHAPGEYSTGWDNGSGNKYWQIDFSSLGYWNIKVSARQRSTATGPRDFKVQYKINSGGTWQNLSILPVLADSFKTSTTTIPELDTASHIYIRWIMNSNTSIAGATVDNAGQSFIDDINVSGTSITLAKQLNYRSKGSGDFESSCNWESTTNPDSTWSQAHGSPDFSAFSIQIRAGHTITINQTVRLDQVVVEAGAALILNNGQLYISGGGTVAGTSGLIIKGTFTDNTSGSNVGLSFISGSSWRLDSAATFIKTGNSGARNYRDFYYTGMSNINATANWIIRYNGVTLPSFTTDSSFYPNLTFESTNGIWNPGATPGSYFFGTTAAGAFATVKGNLDIGGTGNSGTVKIINASPNSQPLLVMGNTLIRSGSELSNIVNASIGTGFDLKGNLNVEGTLTANGGAGLLKMSGAAAQVISGDGIVNVQNFSVANTGSGVKLMRDLMVGGTDSLTQGVLDAGINTLTLNGSLVRTAGYINVKKSITKFNGASSQLIPANAFLNNTLNDLIIASNVSLGGLDTLTGTLSFSGSNRTFTTNNFLTLKSTAAATANVAKVISGNSITGEVVVERYISSKRAWRFLSVPTNTTQTVKQAWQEGAFSRASNAESGYGTQVTDKSATWAANGFDDLSPEGPSVKKYNSITGAYVGIAKTSDLIATREGLMTFVRGDRTAIGIYGTASATKLRTKGSLITGTQPAIPLIAGKFTSIGNPYAAPLDMRLITTSGVGSKKFYVYDPALGTLGAFQTFTKIGNDYYPTPGGGSYPAQNAGTPYNMIASGCAFFAVADVTGTMTITEDAKGNGDLALVQRSAAVTTFPSQVRINLYTLEANDSSSLVDGILSQFSNDFSTAVDKADALKMDNFSENLSIKRDNQLLAIEQKRLIETGDTMQLNLMNLKVRSYKFEIKGHDFMQPGLKGFMEDTYLNTRTPLDLNGNTYFKFHVIDLPGSWNPNRFRIVFKAFASGNSPAAFSLVKASRQDKNIEIEWKVQGAENTLQYVIEKSVNGLQFTSATTLTAKNNTALNYQWTDISPALNNNYYRIKSISNSGAIQYSNIVNVFMEITAPGMSVYPNPVGNGIINLQLTNQPKGIYMLKLLDKAGQLVQAKKINRNEGSSPVTLSVNKTLAAGIYQLEVAKPDNSRSVINVLIK